MTAIELQMIAMFQHSCEPIIKRYDIRLDIDWNTGSINFVTLKEMSQIKLQQFLTEITAVVQQHPILTEVI